VIFNFKTYNKDEVIVRVSDLSKLLDLEKEIEKLQAELAEKDEAIRLAKTILDNVYTYNELPCDFKDEARDWLKKYSKQKDEVK
jgi:predicted component of type VI protein secretion system